MPLTFLGFPLQTWGTVCLAVAVFYLFKWPRPKPDRAGAPRSALAHIVLRWFHSAVWLLLALACYLWAPGPSRVATALAVAALAVYAVFLFTLLADRARD